MKIVQFNKIKVFRLYIYIGDILNQLFFNLALFDLFSLFQVSEVEGI